MHTIFQGKIISNYSLNKTSSSKKINHIELSVPSNASYDPGDVIVFVIQNNEAKEQFAYYSISSSPIKHKNQIHVTASIAQQGKKNDIAQQGKELVYRNLFSQYLDGLQKGSDVKFFIKKNPHFKLPADEKDVIMIGAGTGIAPFRSFLAQRDEHKSQGKNIGKNWLFFGERNSSSDFLYRDELQNYLDSKLLTRLETAFSRDQNHKIYVQDRILENSAEFFSWIKNGAFFYICGDGDKMARDVEKAVLDVISKEGKISEDEARKYLEQMKLDQRYLLDVY
jgi:sulfite reductase (NADPH) flavoprotein alpha-component